MTMMKQTIKPLVAALAAVGVLAGTGAATAAEWSDTSVNYSYGTKFREPFNPSDVAKNRLGLMHVSGYKYGTNLLVANFLMSDSKDPGFGTTSGAQEVYAVYRNTIDYGKVFGKPAAFGWVKDVGLTLGVDANTKNNGYGSKKRAFIVGPTLMMDVPGLLNVTFSAERESNAPNGVPVRYTYKTHPVIDVVWGLPLGGSGFSFEGLAIFTGSKGNDEFGAQTKTESNIDAKLMYDMSPALGTSKGTVKVGFEYQWWKNKFGNDASGPAGSGAFAKTPMLRAEYHF